MLGAKRFFQPFEEARATAVVAPPIFALEAIIASSKVKLNILF